MKTDKIRYLIGTFLLVSIMALGFSKPLKEYIEIPKHLTLFEGQDFTVQSTLPVTTTIQDSSYAFSSATDDQQISVAAKESGEGEMMVEFAGIPVKKVNVNVLSDFRVIPGGQSIGVKLNTLGVLVVGHHQIETEDGKKSPGEIAGVQVGDIIKEINGKKIDKMSDVGPFVQESGKTGEPLDLVIVRDNEDIKTKLMPLKDKNDEAYRIGLYIRDSAAGIGTMTFYHPETKNMGR